MKVTKSIKIKIFNYFLSLFLLMYNNCLKKSYNNLKSIKTFEFENIFNIGINYYYTILIFESNPYHYECTPGYAKYFIDLGYNIDIIMNKKGIDTFCLFDSVKKIRLFTFDNINQVYNNTKKLNLIFNKYAYILIETTEPKNKELFQKLGFFNINNSIFVLHHIDFSESMKISNYYKLNRIWSLGNFDNSLEVNPHYFGKIKLRRKNNKTKFFITSTVQRNYRFLISAVEKLNKENLYFEIIVIGKVKKFSHKNIRKKIQKFFNFKYNVNYSELYREVESSDYIIINLDPNNKNDQQFIKIRVTGSAQLSYGFYKPALINRKYAEFYKMNVNNSFIYDNSNFYEIMREAIILNNHDYKLKQNNLIKLSKNIYKNSYKNIKMTIDSIMK